MLINWFCISYFESYKFLAGFSLTTMITEVSVLYNYNTVVCVKV